MSGSKCENLLPRHQGVTSMHYHCRYLWFYLENTMRRTRGCWRTRNVNHWSVEGSMPSLWQHQGSTVRFIVLILWDSGTTIEHCAYITHNFMTTKRYYHMFCSLCIVLNVWDYGIVVKHCACFIHNLCIPHDNTKVFILAQLLSTVHA